MAAAADLAPAWRVGRGEAEPAAAESGALLAPPTDSRGAAGRWRLVALLAAVVAAFVAAALVVAVWQGGAPAWVESSATKTALETGAEPEWDKIYKAETHGYLSFRIPSLLSFPRFDGAGGSVLLAFAEGRNQPGDTGEIHVVLRRSLNNGKTWSRLSVVADPKAVGIPGATVGNPTPVYDSVFNRVVLLVTVNFGEDDEVDIITGYSKGTRQVFMLMSQDEGALWTKPRNITHMVMRKSWTWYATGPGAGIQMSGNKWGGRLVVACDHVDSTPDGFVKWASHIIYSDDGGDTWNIGAVATGFTNECAVAQLPRSDVLVLNMRTEPPLGHRMVQISRDGGQTLEEAALDKDLVDPGVQGHMLAVSDGLLFSNPNFPFGRRNFTIKFRSAHSIPMSIKESTMPDISDNWKTHQTSLTGSWSVQYQVHEGPAAYSSLARVGDDVLCLFESGDGQANEAISLARVPLDYFRER